VDATDFVTIGIGEIAQIHRTHAAFALAGRVFGRCATIGDRHIVELLQLLRRIARKAKGEPVGNRRRFAIDWLADGESAAVVHVKQARLTGVVDMNHRLSRTEYAQNLRVESLRLLDIVRTDHRVIEHEMRTPLMD